MTMDMVLHSLLSGWFLPTFGSALVLGFYDFSKKHAVRDNAAAPVLFFSTLSGTLFFVLLTLLTGKWQLSVCCTPGVYGFLCCKSLIVGASWWCVYYAMRDLPLSIAAPIRASSPVWTFIGALFLYGELPGILQGAAMLMIFVGYCIFSLLGKLEGFSWKSGGMVWIFAGTVLGAVSALYDKFLLAKLHLPPETVQFYFSLNLLPVLGLGWLLVHCFGCREKFVWRHSIISTGILLIMADWLYFYALSKPEVQISILSLVRRCGCIVPFVLGALYFHDRHMRGKAIALAVILIGVAVLGLCG